MSFIMHLQARKLSDKTIKTYVKYQQFFTDWLLAEGISADTFTYNDLLTFMQHLEQTGKRKQGINMQVCVVRHYLHYLIREGKRSDNPASGVFVKGQVRKLPSGLLSMEQLEELYQHYHLQLHIDVSKKIMLGLLIWQGITVGELMRLEAADIKLNAGKLFIKGTRRSNERLLSLQAVQIADLQAYLKANVFKEGGLFTEPRKHPVSDFNIKNRIQYMFGQLQQLNANIINAQQIRSSVITHWLKSNELRQVQYMAGHKYVSSTERYQLNHLDDLSRSVQQHHPMR